MQNEYEIKKQICDIGRRIYSRNMVAANDEFTTVEWLQLMTETFL